MSACCLEKNPKHTPAQASLLQAVAEVPVGNALNCSWRPQGPEQSPGNLQHRDNGHRVANFFKWPHQKGFHSFCLKTNSQTKHVHCEKAFSYMQHFIVNNSVTYPPLLAVLPCLLTGWEECFYLFCFTSGWSHDPIECNMLCCLSKSRSLTLESSLADAELYPANTGPFQATA